MDKTPVSSEKKLTLFLLCWIFGLFGVHRFYLGKYFSGSLYPLALTLGGVLSLSKSEVLPPIPLCLLFLGWIVDFMLIIMGKFTDKEGKPIIDWV